MAEHTNRLADESSPYLRQHQHNPVDWYPWSPEALERARSENKPIFLSIGYSACHWCHVMERECFENEEIARLMNEQFINIKVDREERPDIDHIYMNAVQMMTGHGGWPLSVFLTPDGRPFYGGTYFPPQDRHNLPGFPRVLTAIAQAYQQRPEEVQASVGKLLAGLQRMERYEATPEPLRPETVLQAAAGLAQLYDASHGGLGRAPKFPNESALELFLRAHHATGQERYLEMVTHTLRRMAMGGIYDHLGGGFHRYSVDERWLVPHFEKMLYDNAQLASLYVDTLLASGDRFFAQVADDVLRYVVREMRQPGGGFSSTQDADSEGEEGRFFVWTADEVQRVLGEDAELFCRYYDVTDVGNFEHKNILHPTLEVEQLAKLFRLEADETRQRLDKARRKLFASREQRVKPGLDDKVLTAWNGLMISAFAKAGEALGNTAHLDVARQAVDFVFRELWRDGRLLSTYKDGTAKFTGHLDDYAFMAAALVDLFEATQEQEHLDRALDLVRVMNAHFWDSEGGGYFFTADDHETLIVRSKPGFDGSIPSGNSAAARTLLRLYHHTGDAQLLERAETLLRLFYRQMQQQAFGLANMLCALDFFLRRPKEIVIVGAAAAAATRELLERVRSRYLPNRVLRVADPSQGALPDVLAGKGQVDGKVTAYVCHSMTCSPPATSWAELEPLLA
jgi:hypothetical protein